MSISWLLSANLQPVNEKHMPSIGISISTILNTPITIRPLTACIWKQPLKKWTTISTNSKLWITIKSLTSYNRPGNGQLWTLAWVLQSKSNHLPTRNRQQQWRRVGNHQYYVKSSKHNKATYSLQWEAIMQKDGQLSAPYWSL